MSLEAQLEKLNENLGRLCDLLANPASAPITGPLAAAAEKAAGAEPTKVSTAPKAEPTKTAPAPAAAPAVGAVPYDDVKKAVIELASKKGRDAAVAVLTTFGVEKATDLKPEQYAEALAALKKAGE